MRPIRWNVTDITQRQSLQMTVWGSCFRTSAASGSLSSGSQAAALRDIGSLFLRRRCVVPADAIFEWQRAPKGVKKQKYEIVVPGWEPFGMAGVWKLCKNPKTDRWEQWFVILTGEPNELLRPILDRMISVSVRAAATPPPSHPASGRYARYFDYGAGSGGKSIASF